MSLSLCPPFLRAAPAQTRPEGMLALQGLALLATTDTRRGTSIASSQEFRTGTVRDAVCHSCKSVNRGHANQEVR